ncbi:GAF domain-containing protein [Synergistaceae bacterium OttesenSCG-928-D05]|nr:GAF domain-containing protein [Synergistaceae bacterium OttesenSCG-928-D05]
MVHIEEKSFGSKREMYESMFDALRALLEESGDRVANLANTSAFLKFFLEETNWVGFYLVKNGVLVLGPFQGKPAVTMIEPGHGVCGTALVQKKTQVVENVHKCENHIACDSASLSEIVVPMQKDGRVLGVIDIDSPAEARFDEEDAAGLEKIARLLSEQIRWED